MNPEQFRHGHDNPNPEPMPPPPGRWRYTLNIWYHGNKDYPEMIMQLHSRPHIIGGAVLAYETYGDVTTTTQHCIPLTSIRRYTVTDFFG